MGNYRLENIRIAPDELVLYRPFEHYRTQYIVLDPTGPKLDPCGTLTGGGRPTTVFSVLTFTAMLDERGGAIHGKGSLLISKLKERVIKKFTKFNRIICLDLGST